MEIGYTEREMERLVVTKRMAKLLKLRFQNLGEIT